MIALTSSLFVRVALFYVYALLMAIPLVAYDVSLLVAVVLLLAGPVLFFFYQEKFSCTHVFLLSLFAIIVSFLWESVSYTNGVWYHLSSFDVRILGLFPPEIVVRNIAIVLFVVMAYEYFFDDKKTIAPSWNQKNVYLFVFNAVLVAAAIVSLFFLTRLYVPFTFVLLLLSLIVSVAVSSLIVHKHTLHVFKKALFSSLALFPFFVLLEAIAALNVYWVFANTGEYLYSFDIGSSVLPIEQFLLLLIVPFWIVSVYEFYLDDGV